MPEYIINLIILNLDVLINLDFGRGCGVLGELEGLSQILSTIHGVVKDAKMNQFTNKAYARWQRMLKHVAYDAHDAFAFELYCGVNPSQLGPEQQVSYCSDLYVRLSDTSLFKTFEHKFRIILAEKPNIDLRSKPVMLSPLVLNYIHLPPHLRQCLAYCSIFPKGYEMKVDELIALWIANDFIAAEDVADTTYNHLFEHSFFQDCTKNFCGDKIITCKIHNVMHDVASSLMDGECSIIEVDHNSTKQLQKVRHVSLICNESPQSSTLLDSLFESHASLRTLIFYPNPTLELSRMLDFSSVKNLRALSLRGMSIETLSSSICHLMHLRYLNLSKNLFTSVPESIGNLRRLRFLDLSENYSLTTLPLSIDRLQSLRRLNLSDCNLIKSLPESLGGLQNLQSLMVRGCSSLEALPVTIANINCLKHLDIQGCQELTKMPVGIGKLTHLQTLPLFVVGKPDGDIGCGGIEELQGLDRLNGELQIEGLENVRNSMDAREAKLKRKSCLTKLKLSWDSVHSGQESNTYNVLEDLKLPCNILQLLINEFPLPTCFPQTFLENLNNLQYLEISNCKKMGSLPEGLPKLTSLQELRIEFCNSIECLPAMGVEELNSSLEFLTIESCDSLTSVSEGLLHLTSLKKLSFHHCPELELEKDDFQHLISLLYLGVQWVPKLRAFPEVMQHLTMLQNLEIGYCWNLRMLPEGLKYLTSLEELKIHYCPDLELVEKDFQHLISLRNLKLGFLPKLTTFPVGIQGLPKLQNLKVWRCENLRMLPEWLKHLTALKSLKIRDCHLDLQNRCKQKEGEDWHIISHIPNLDIYKPLMDSSTAGGQQQRDEPNMELGEPNRELGQPNRELCEPKRKVGHKVIQMLSSILFLRRK